MQISVGFTLVDFWLKLLVKARNQQVLVRLQMNTVQVVLLDFFFLSSEIRRFSYFYKGKIALAFSTANARLLSYRCIRLGVNIRLIQRLVVLLLLVSCEPLPVFELGQL